MRNWRRPVWQIPGAAVAIFCIALLLATSRSNVSAVTISTTPPPPTASEPSSALVDDHGALLIFPGVDGGLRTVGVVRGHGVAWRTPLGPGIFPIGCVKCPDTLVSNKAGRLGELMRGRLRWFISGLRLDMALGLPGFAIAQGPTVLATDEGNELALRVLGKTDVGASRLLASRPTLLPVDDFQRAHGAIDIGSTGVVSAVAEKDFLHPATFALAVADGPNVLLRRQVTGFLTTISDTPDVATCVSADGAEVAFVLEGRGGLELLRGPTRGPLQSVPLGLPGSVVACNQTKTTTWVASYPNPYTSIRMVLTEVSRDAAVSSRRLSVPVATAAFCRGSGRLLVDGEHGAFITKGLSGGVNVPNAALAGCTEQGTPWYIAGRSISWVKHAG